MGYIPPPPEKLHRPPHMDEPYVPYVQLPVQNNPIYRTEKPIVALLIWTLLCGFLIGFYVKGTIIEKATTRRDVRSESTEVYPDYDDYAEEVKESSKDSTAHQ